MRFSLTERAVLLRGVAGLCVVVAFTGCGGSSDGNGSTTGANTGGAGSGTGTTPTQEEVNTVGVSPMQTVLDGAPAAVDLIPNATSNPESGISSQEIVAIQTAFDKIADSLL